MNERALLVARYIAFPRTRRTDSLEQRRLEHDCDAIASPMGAPAASLRNNRAALRSATCSMNSCRNISRLSLTEANALPVSMPIAICCCTGPARRRVRSPERDTNTHAESEETLEEVPRQTPARR